MGLVIAITFSLAAWLVLWSLDIKAIDAFFVPLIVTLVAITVRMVLAPSRQQPKSTS